MTRRIVTGFLVFLLSFGFFVLYPPSVKAIKDFSVEVTPRRAGSIARYAFTMSFEKTLRVHEWLHLSFPKGTKLFPPLPEEEYQRKLRLKEISESILYGPPCSACTGLPIIGFESDGTVMLKFHVTPEVDPTKEGYKTITITILETAGFTNPPSTGEYIYKFRNQQETTFVESKPVFIEESRISKPLVTVQNPIFNQMSGYDIEFKTGSAGQLGFRTNTITLMFPQGTIVSIPPKEILYQVITINGYPILNSPIIQDMYITFVLPFKIPDDSRIKIHIDPRWGIRNPRNPGKYKITAFTSTDIDPVESEFFEIKKGPDSVFLDVKPPRVDRIADFTLTFVAKDQALDTGETIQVLFPDLFTLPSAIDPHLVTIQGKVVDLVEITGHIVSVKLNQSIQKGEGIELVFSKDVGIRTPKVPCEIGVVVTLKNAKVDLYSNLAEIIWQAIEVRKILVNPPNENEKASYQISLLFGDQLIPEPGEEIQVQFNFIEKPIIYAVGDSISQEFILTLPGIVNPPTGRYSVRITTEKEKVTTVESIWIIPARPVTKINLSSGKIGKNGWYVEVPLISFESNDPESFISYYWDDIKNGIWNYAGQPMPPDPGQFISRIYYYSENAYGQEDPKYIEIKVDYVNPEIGSIFPENKKIEINKNEFTIEGKASPIKTIVYGADKIEPDRNLTIQDKSVEVRDDGTFTYDATLQEGINEITVHLEDDAGRYVEKKYTVLLDSIPPNLEVVYPVQNATILEKKMLLRGKTEPNTFLLINGEFVFVEEDGS